MRPEAAVEYIFVQVRYPGLPRWVTLAAGNDRRVAASQAARGYRSLRSAEGRLPDQVRVIDETTLRREGGDETVRRAYDDLFARATGEPITAAMSAAAR